MKQQEHGRIRMRTERERADIKAAIGRNIRRCRRLDREIAEIKERWLALYGTAELRERWRAP